MERFRKTEAIVLGFSIYLCVCIHEHVELHASLNVDGLYRRTHRAVTMPSSSRQQQSEVRLLGLSVCSGEASVKDSKLCVRERERELFCFNYRHGDHV